MANLDPSQQVAPAQANPGMLATSFASSPQSQNDDGAWYKSDPVVSTGSAPTPASAGGSSDDWYKSDPIIGSGAASAPTGFQPAPPSATAPPPAPSSSGTSWGQWIDDAGREAAQIPSFGLADKFAAGMDALTHPILGRGSDAATIGQRYADDLTAERAQTAADPMSAKVVGNTAGLVGAVASDAPGLALRGAGSAIEAIPGANALLSYARPAADTVGSTVENALLRLPGGSVVAPVAQSAATNALLGAGVGAADADGDLKAHLQGAEQGAIVGGGLGAAGTVAAKAVQPIVRIGKAIYADLGKGATNALTDDQGAAVSAPVTQSQADKAAAIARNFTSDPAATSAALDAHVVQPDTVPGFYPTTYQVTGDTGLGQLEQGVKVGNQQAFVDRANQQNDALVQAVNDKAPADADAYAVQPAIQAQVDAADATGQQQVAQATAARDQTAAQLPSTTDATVDNAGATLRQQVDQQRAPAIQQADARVQQAQQTARDATTAVGGASGSDGQTALQDIGGQFRQTLSDADDAAKTRVSGLYDQADPEGKLAVDVTPLKQTSAGIVGSMSQSAKPIAGEEADIHNLIASYPQVQSLAEVRDLSSRIGDEIANQRGPGGNAQVVRRLTQLKSALDGNLDSAADGQGVTAAVATPAATALQKGPMVGQIEDWYASKNADQADAVGFGGGDAGPGRNAVGGSGAVYPGYAGEGQAGGRLGPAARSAGVSAPPQQPVGADDLASLRAANAAHRERIETYQRAPGVGDVLAEHSAGRGGFKFADSEVPGRLFSGSPKAAERVQAAVKAGLPADDLARYAAFSMRRAAENPDGTLDPARYQSWLKSNGEAFNALSQAHPPIVRMFANADQAARTLQVMHAERAAIDAAHPIKPGWSDADVAMQAVKPGPTGRNRVQAMLANAGNTDQAKAAVQDVLAHLYQTKVIKGGEIDQNAHERFLKDYGGALSAAPDLATKFKSVASAQKTVDAAQAAHTQAVTDLQKSAARYFLGGGEPADRIGQALADPNRVGNMRDLVRLTQNDQTARDGLKRAVVDYMNKNLLSQTTVSQAGERRIKPEMMQKFINEKGAALKELFTPAEMDGFSKISDALNTANQSTRNTRPQGGSDTVYKAAAALKAGGTGSPLVVALKEHTAEALGGVTGAKAGSAFGPIGAVIGSVMGGISGKVVQSMRQANIKSVEDLVTEAMLNPGLMRVLLSRVTPENRENVGKAWVGALKRLAVVQAAQHPAALAGAGGAAGVMAATHLAGMIAK